MRFPVLTDEELNKPLYAPGTYWFTVKNMEEAVSKAGNSMIKIEITVFFENGPLAIYDYLLGTKEASWKISQFCKSIGREGLYKMGNIEPVDILGQRGKCEIHYQENDGKKYLRVKSYIIPEKNNETETVEEKLDDEIPF